MRLYRSLLAVAVILLGGSTAAAQEPAPSALRLTVSGGVLGHSVRDAGVSPLLYSGAAPSLQLDFARAISRRHTLLRLRLDRGNIESAVDRSVAYGAEFATLGLEAAHLGTVGRRWGGALHIQAGLGVEALGRYRAQSFPGGGFVEERDDASVFAALCPTLRLDHPDVGGGSVAYRASGVLAGITYHVVPGQPLVRRWVSFADWRQVEQEFEYSRPLSRYWDWGASYRLDWMHYLPERETEWVNHRFALGLTWVPRRGDAQ